MFNFRILLFLLILIPFSSGAVNILGGEIEVGDSFRIVQGVSIIQPNFNFSTLNVTGSNFWLTDIGALGTANATQHNNVGGTLTIDEDWLDSFGDGLWLALDGSNSPTSDINWGGFAINNLGLLNMTGNINLNDKIIIFDEQGNHFIRENVDGIPFDGIAKASLWMGHSEPHPEGEITFLFTNQNNTNLWMQSGRNNSYSGLGNSFGLVPLYMAKDNFTENNIINMSKASDYPLLCSIFGIDCSFNADTRGNAIDLIPGGPLLWTMGDLEVWQSAKIHIGLSVDGISIFNLEGNDLEVNNGTLHIATPVTFEQGFTAGDSVTKFLETFASGLAIFNNLQTDLGDWKSVINSVFCDEGQCAQGTGAGGGLIEMQTNISTLDINETTLSFVYSLVSLIGSGEFSIEVNNNVGSGDVVIFSDTTDDVTKSSQVISLPSSMDNQSLISITVICDIASTNRPARQCFIDTMKLNGTAITTTLINVSGFDGVIKFSDGALAPDGFPKRGIIFNASGDTIIFRGNATFENIIEQTLNITESISLNGTNIFDWSGVVTSPLFPEYFLLNGSSVIQANANFGGFNIINISDGDFSNNIDVGNNVTLDSGAKFWSNATCAFISSPNGGSVLEVCDP